MRYLLSMGIRTVCFVLAIVDDGSAALDPGGGGLFLPYVAVVLANATDRRRSPGPACSPTTRSPTIEARPLDDEPRRDDS